MNEQSILIIDDDAIILSIIKEILEDEGYSVHTSTNSIEANRYIFCSTPPDLIIIDYMMPLASGDNKINLLKGNDSTKKIPIVLMSGKSEDELLSIMLRSGADAYLVKPFSPKKLIAVVKTTIRNAGIK